VSVLIALSSPPFRWRMITPSYSNSFEGPCGTTNTMPGRYTLKERVQPPLLRGGPEIHDFFVLCGLPQLRLLIGRTMWRGSARAATELQAEARVVRRTDGGWCGYVRLNFSSFIPGQDGKWCVFLQPFSQQQQEEGSQKTISASRPLLCSSARLPGFLLSVPGILKLKHSNTQLGVTVGLQGHLYSNIIATSLPLLLPKSQRQHPSKVNHKVEACSSRDVAYAAALLSHDLSGDRASASTMVALIEVKATEEYDAPPHAELVFKHVPSSDKGSIHGPTASAVPPTGAPKADTPSSLLPNPLALVDLVAQLRRSRRPLSLLLLHSGPLQEGGISDALRLLGSEYTADLSMGVEIGERKDGRTKNELYKWRVQFQDIGAAFDPYSQPPLSLTASQLSLYKGADILLGVGPFAGHVDYFMSWLRSVAKVRTPSVMLVARGQVQLPARHFVHQVHSAVFVPGPWAASLLHLRVFNRSNPVTDHETSNDLHPLVLPSGIAVPTALLRDSRSPGGVSVSRGGVVVLGCGDEVLQLGSELGARMGDHCDWRSIHDQAQQLLLDKGMSTNLEVEFMVDPLSRPGLWLQEARQAGLNVSFSSSVATRMAVWRRVQLVVTTTPLTPLLHSEQVAPSLFISNPLIYCCALL
jgi:hypothetical protein